MIDSIDSTYIYTYMSLYYRQSIYIYIYIHNHTYVWHTSHKELPQPLYISQHIVGTWVIRPGTHVLVMGISMVHKHRETPLFWLTPPI